MTKKIMTVLLGMTATAPSFAFNLFSQGKGILALNLVLLIAIIGFLVFLKYKEKGERE